MAETRFKVETENGGSRIFNSLHEMIGWRYSNYEFLKVLKHRPVMYKEIDGVFKKIKCHIEVDLLEE